MTLSAFKAELPYGDIILSLCIVLFAFTTMLGWSYYGERCAEFLLGPKDNYAVSGAMGDWVFSWVRR